MVERISKSPPASVFMQEHTETLTIEPLEEAAADTAASRNAITEHALVYIPLTVGTAVLIAAMLYPAEWPPQITWTVHELANWVKHGVEIAGH